MKITLNDYEIHKAHTNPTVLFALADWHSYIATQAEAVGDEMTTNRSKNRAVELRAAAEYYNERWINT